MKRVVIKIGTNALVDVTGTIKPENLEKLAQEIKNAQAKKLEIILVSSGAVSQGQARAKKFPRLSKCSYAAIGQGELVGQYVSAFDKHKLTIGQILLSQRDLQNKDTYNSLQSTINEMTAAGVIPVINENDVITCGTKATFHDNDSLSVALALTTNADLLLILSHIDGLYTQDPKNADAKLIHSVKDVSRELIKLCEKTTSARGSGGMIAKVKAARLACAFGITTIVVNSGIENVITKALDGESVGTHFAPRQNSPKLRARSRWIVSAKISTGSVVVDKGAVSAIQKGKSLLAVGIKKLYGEFKENEIIEVVDPFEDALAVGIVGVDDRTLREKIKKGDLYNQEIIHADNLILIR